MARTVRWGVLSTAHHAANRVIPAIHASEHGEVVAVASRDADRGRQYAQANRIPRSYDSYEALLADPNVDVVYIPLPNSLHKEWAIRAAQAGKHVLCEKSLALNAFEAQEMVAAARKAGVRLAEAFQWRHHPQATRLRELVREGVAGELRLLDSGFSFPQTNPNDIRWDPALGGGALYDIGCYPVSFARYITGQEPLSVTAQMHWNATGVDDSVVATLEFPGGVLAHFNCSFIMPLRRYYEVVGDKGILSVDRTYFPVGEADFEITFAPQERDVKQRFPLPAANSYTLMVEDFSRAVLENRDPLFPPEDGIAQMRVIDAIFQAAREGRRVGVAK
jgi:predicted dehydrogenase